MRDDALFKLTGKGVSIGGDPEILLEASRREGLYYMCCHTKMNLQKKICER
jgi:hypothetical protein